MSERQCVRGAHAPRVLVSAPSPKRTSRAGAGLVALEEKVRDGEGAIASTRGACAPQNSPRASSNTAHSLNVPRFLRLDDEARVRSFCGTRHKKWIVEVLTIEICAGSTRR